MSDATELARVCDRPSSRRRRCQAADREQQQQHTFNPAEYQHPRVDAAALPASSLTPPDGGAAPGAAGGTAAPGPQVGSSQAGASAGNQTALAFGIVAIFLAVGIVIFRLYYRASCCAPQAPRRRGECVCPAGARPSCSSPMLLSLVPPGTAGAAPRRCRWWGLLCRAGGRRSDSTASLPSTRAAPCGSGSGRSGHRGRGAALLPHVLMRAAGACQAHCVAEAGAGCRHWAALTCTRTQAPSCILPACLPACS